MLKGVFTAIITPFKDGNIDYESYYKILDRQIQCGITGIVPCGTTGESPTLSFEEHSEFIRKTVEYVNKRVLVIAGTGSNSTTEAIKLTNDACEDGVDGILSVNPYYNKPTQEGLYQHFLKIAQVSSKPVMLYNIPGRTGVNLLPETINRLADHPNIKAVKEASGNLGQMAQLIMLCGDKLNVLSGDDSLVLPLMAIGGKGVVSVVSNLFPRSMSKLVTLIEGNEMEEARKLYFKLLPVFNLSMIETNPIPVKTAMNWLGHCTDEIRLPLTSMTRGTNYDQFNKIIFQLRDNGFE
ncbi:MAG: 4-hydroxy-tetrahydrodipicolinate synthase [Leptospiraceae bacterium]|nr:4-hydroxy-tetrahydrodipicolinate synthase [Leptospiraceae bacterium]MCP5497841.1 4-hydroxy-tetrahydrodipicolinate synthase [Leptospiraceae bacterium]